MRIGSDSTHKKYPTLSLKPDFIVRRIEDIDFKELKELGIASCLVDLDDTVVERGKFEVSPSIKEALKNSGMDVYIATNRPRSRDLKDLKTSLGAVGVIHPHGIFGKPTKTYFTNALNDFSLKRETVIMIGDRFIQDILGANRSGIYSLLVAKLGKPRGFADALLSRTEQKYADILLREQRIK